MPFWLSPTIALVWRHGALELPLIFLAVFAGLFIIAGAVYCAGYFVWLLPARWVAPWIARRAAAWPAGSARGILGATAVAGVALILGASLPLVTVSAQLTAYPSQGQFRLDAPYQELESTVAASARSLLPLIADLREATDRGRAFGDRPLAQPRPARPLLGDQQPGLMPIDPLAALGLLALFEAVLALARRGRIGLTGHALALTGLAGVAYLVALPYWAGGLARLAVDAEGYITNPNLPLDRFVVTFVTAPGYWIVMLLCFALLAAGLVLNARRPEAIVR